MEEEYASKYRRIEESHWWFLGRRDIIYKLIKDHHRYTEILEVGCSGGTLLGCLRGNELVELYGIDIDKEAIEICRKKGITNVHVADAEKTGFKDQQFDIVIASDVLEHIRNEDKALFEWHRILKPKGILIIFVPAFKFLWSKHDEVNHHYRRYSKSELIGILEKNGFDVKRSLYWNFTLFFPIAFIRFFQRLFPGRKDSGDQLYEVPTFINRALEYILRLENKLLSVGISFPVGVSVFAIAKKV